MKSPHSKSLRFWQQLSTGLALGLTLPLSADEPPRSTTPTTPVPAVAEPRSGRSSSAQPQLSELATLNLDTLLNLEISSVSRKEQKLTESAAAVYVITQEEIRRAGATSLPEALRLVPGLEVARIDAKNYAISARGFNDQFANKLLVMIDGRSVYTPLFSGTFWDVQDTVMADVDRIEVIRGPGATVWGANAVNGVINVITKSSQQTQGTLVSVGGGNPDYGIAAIRHGGQLRENAFYRVFVKGITHGDMSGVGDSNDGFSMLRGGLRTDWNLSEQSTLTFGGEVSDGWLNQTYLTPSLLPPYEFENAQVVRVKGGNGLGRWVRDFSEDSKLTVQASYERTVREASIFYEDRSTYDIDGNHQVALTERHTLGYGLGYRLTTDNLQDTFTISHSPRRRQFQLFSGFVEDEIQLAPDKLRLTLGSKFEHNDFTGFEVQPGGRMIWTPDGHHSIWGAISRAVRTPSRAERDIELHMRTYPPGVAGPFPAVQTFFGSEDFNSEELTAYEIGYRVQPHKRFAVDLATFYNEYDSLRTLRPAAPYVDMTGGVPHVIVPFEADNNLRGRTYGGELALSWQATDQWQLRGSYSHLQMELHRTGSTRDYVEDFHRRSPQHQFALRSYLELPRHFELDGGIRYVSELPGLNIPAYTSLELRLGWRPSPNWEFSIVGRNLLDGRHPEFSSTLVRARQVEIERSVFASVTCRF